jgi:cation diffusion facilitator family transporter
MTANKDSAMTRPDHDLSAWAHDHAFDSGNRRGEASTRVVLAVTLITMVAEIVGGWWTGSMALLADGWHMGTHSLALGVAAAAYALARRHAGDSRYAFGTWKIEVLGGFASALVLALVAVAITFESALRLWRAEPIAAGTALWVAVIGLLVNLLSAWLLHGADGHAGEGDDGHAHGHHAKSDGKHQPHSRAQGHGHGHSHGHAHHHAHGDAKAQVRPAAGQDLNLRAAYVHVLADALTSVLAIAALCAALWLGWWWLDPLVGVLGAVVIGVWAFGLLRETAAVLLDREMDHPLTLQIREAIESDADARVADLHLWRVGRQHHAVIVCVVAAVPLSPADYRARLAGYPSLVHVSVEVNRSPGTSDTPA